MAEQKEIIYEKLIDERPLTIINKGQVIAHAWQHCPKEERFDLSGHLELIAEVFKALAGRPKLICIEGESGSGKTILGQVLCADGTNTEFINIAHYAKEQGQGIGEVDISSIMADPSKTYILDEVVYAAPNSLIEAIQRHAQAEGVAVLLIENARDIHPGLMRYMTIFHLDRDEFWFKA